MPRPRRQLMGGAALAATAVGANDRSGVGLIGCGGRGRSNLEVFKTDPSCRIVAICDVDQGGAEETRASLSSPPDIYSDFRRLLERKDIDAVIVATPDHWHAIPALQAMRAGKDVYLEKPIGHTLEEGAALVAEAERSGRLLEVGLQQRSGTLFADAERVIREGALGKISLVHCLNVWTRASRATWITRFFARRIHARMAWGIRPMAIRRREWITISGSARPRSGGSIPTAFTGIICTFGITRAEWSSPGASICWTACGICSASVGPVPCRLPVGATFS